MPARSRPTIFVFVYSIILVLLLWVANLKFGGSLPGPTDRGTFGDQFGAVNALFAGLAFAGVLYAIVLQRHEVEILHEEMEASRETIREQQKLTEAQIGAQAQQRFEITFFNMLTLLSDVVSEMDGSAFGSEPAKGRKAFEHMLRKIRDKEPLKSANFYPNSMPPRGDEGDTAFESSYLEHSDIFGRYFRTLYNILKFIDRAEAENARTYSDLLRAQISESEATLLYLNGVSTRGIDKMKPLLEKFGMLKNANLEDKSVKYSRGQILYAPSAFV